MVSWRVGAGAPHVVSAGWTTGSSVAVYPMMAAAVSAMVTAIRWSRLRMSVPFFGCLYKR